MRDARPDSLSARYANRLLLALPLILALCVALSFAVHASTTWYVQGETLTVGTSNGYAYESSEDSSSNVKTEASAGETISVNTYPTGDDSVGWDYIGGLCGIPGNTHTACLTQPLEPNGNSSYIATSVSWPVDGTDEDRYSAYDPELPASATISQIDVWANVRWNGSNNEVIISLSLYDGTQCPYDVHEQASPNAAGWTNITSTFATSCDEDAWASADLASLLLVLRAHVIDAAGTVAVTDLGALVRYSSYYLDFTSSFGNVDGSNYALEYVCTTTDEETSLNVAFNGPQGTITCDGALRTSGLPTIHGSVSVQLSSTTPTGDGTASTYSFDLLILKSDVDEDGKDPGKKTPISCTYDWLSRAFSCFTTYSPPASTQVLEYRWELYRGRNATDELSHANGQSVKLPTTSPFYDVLDDDYVVVLRVVHTYGINAYPANVRDGDLLWLVVYSAVAAVLLLLLYYLRSGVSLKTFKETGKLPSVSPLYKVAARDVEEYRGWTSYELRDPKRYKSTFTRRRGQKVVVYGITRRDRVEVQAVRVRKEATS